MTPHIDAPGRGIALMLAGILVLTLNDATAKWLAADYPIPQIISLRGVFILTPLAFILLLRGGIGAFKPHRFRNHAVRSLCFIGSTFFIITALSLMPLADAIAFTFTTPLIVAALAPFILGEHVGWRRWTAVLIGFTGVLVMVRPTGEAVQWAGLFPLCASLMGAFRDVTTRKLSTSETSISMLCFSTGVVVLVGAATAPFGWAPMTAKDVGLMALSGFLVGTAHFLLIESFRLAEAALVAPFKYFNMVWAVLFGFVIWGHVPDTWTVTGAVFVIASVLYTTRREAEIRRGQGG